MPKAKPAVSKKTKRNAKKKFNKAPHNTRPFTANDYENLKKENTVAAV